MVNKVKKNVWKEVETSKFNIVARTEKACLIEMPHYSKYNGFVFWISKKLVKDGDDVEVINDQRKIIFNDSFFFEIFKSVKKDGRFVTKDEQTISAQQFEDAFNDTEDEE